MANIGRHMLLEEDIICDCDSVVATTTVHYQTCAKILQERLKNGEMKRLPRNKDGVLLKTNQHLNNRPDDYLYHLAIGNQTHDLKKMFGDVKFVCMGGTAHRMHKFALMVAEELNIEIGPAGLEDITAASLRYSMYKVGPVLAVNHGIGTASLNVVLQEVLKVMQHAEAKDPIFVRMGTSGGLAVTPGTVVVTNKAFNGLLENSYNLAILGNLVKFPSILDQKLAEELQNMSAPEDDFATICAGTMAAEDFYQGQGRLDGPFCDYCEQDKMDYLEKLRANSVRNIEMEAAAFSAFTRMAGAKAAIVCVTFLDRFNGDQVSTTKEILMQWEQRPMTIVIRYIKRYLKKHGLL